VEVLPEIVLIRGDAEQAPTISRCIPGLLHGWNGGADVDSLAAAIADEQSALAINAVHPTLDGQIRSIDFD